MVIILTVYEVSQLVLLEESWDIIEPRNLS